MFAIWKIIIIYIANIDLEDIREHAKLFQNKLYWQYRQAAEMTTILFDVQAWSISVVNRSRLLATNYYAC